MIRVSHLTKTYKGVDVLRDVSVDIPEGRVTGLHGVNGSGKTMLMRAVCGLIRPTSGQILIDGVELGRERSFPEDIGALIEGPAFLPRLSGYRNLKLLADIRRVVDEEGIRQVMARVGLDPNSPKRYRTYSLGMKQRLGIAAAIMEKPRIVVLDEPTNALDSSGVTMLKRVVRELRAQGATVLVSCHDNDVLRELSDTIYHMAEGRVDGVEILDAKQGGVQDAAA